MSIFYLLPPRPVLGDRLANFFHTLLPGLDWDVAGRMRLAEMLHTAAQSLADVYIVHREDLPQGEAVNRALADGFGAEPGDEVVELRAGPRPGELVSQRWRVG